MRSHVSSKHIDARQFKCDHCEKSFNLARALRMHMYTHTGEKPYNCNLCSSGFKQNSILRKHFAKVHDIQYVIEDIQSISGVTPRKKI